MPSTKKTKYKRPSGNRKTAGKGRRSKDGIPAQPVSGDPRGSRTAGSTIRSVTSALLNPGIGSVSPFSFTTSLMPALNPFPEISFEKGLNDLYACMKKVPGFKDNKVWSKQPTQVELLHYLFGKLRLLKGAKREWAFVRDEDGNLSLVFFKELYAISQNSSMPLEWLPRLEKKNPELHEAFIAVIGVIARRWNLNLIYNDHIDYYLEEGMMQEADTEVDMKIIEFDVQKYRKGGIAYEYAKRIEAHGKKSVKQLEELLWKVNYARTHGQRAICQLCRTGIELLQYQATIDDYHTLELLEEMGDYSRREVVAPREYYWFPWSNFDNVTDSANDTTVNIENEIGVANIIVKDHYYPNRKTVTVVPEPIKALNRFFYHAHRVYREYYYDQISYQHKKDHAEIEASLQNSATV